MPLGDLGYVGFQKPDAYTPYAAGPKMYGFGARLNPTSGPVDKAGYQERDQQAQARKNIILQRMSAEQQKRFASPEFLGGLR